MAGEEKFKELDFNYLRVVYKGLTIKFLIIKNMKNSLTSPGYKIFSHSYFNS